MRRKRSEGKKKYKFTEEHKKHISEALRRFKMPPVQVRLTSKQIEKLDKLVKRGIYPNRSEAIRDAVRRLIGMAG